MSKVFSQFVRSRPIVLAVTVIAFGLATMPTVTALAENCVQGVRALLPWTSAIKGNARDWPNAARKAGFVVDKILAKDCVLVYHGDYGNRISVYGHVARIVDPKVKNGQIQIQDSYESDKGVPIKTREIRWVRVPTGTKWSVIHPKR